MHSSLLVLICLGVSQPKMSLFCDRFHIRPVQFVESFNKSPFFQPGKHSIDADCKMYACLRPALFADIHSRRFTELVFFRSRLLMLLECWQLHHTVQSDTSCMSDCAPLGCCSTKCYVFFTCHQGVLNIYFKCH